jgi:hypothetical protein
MLLIFRFLSDKYIVWCRCIFANRVDGRRDRGLLLRHPVFALPCLLTPRASFTLLGAQGCGDTLTPITPWAL